MKSLILFGLGLKYSRRCYIYIDSCISFSFCYLGGHATQSNARLPGFLSSETNVPFGQLLHWSLTYAKVSEKKPPETRSHEKKKKSNLEP